MPSHVIPSSYNQTGSTFVHWVFCTPQLSGPQHSQTSCLDLVYLYRGSVLRIRKQLMWLFAVFEKLGGSWIVISVRETLCCARVHHKTAPNKAEYSPCAVNCSLYRSTWMISPSRHRRPSSPNCVSLPRGSPPPTNTTVNVDQMRCHRKKTSPAGSHGTMYTQTKHLRQVGKPYHTSALAQGINLATSQGLFHPIHASLVVYACRSHHTYAVTIARTLIRRRP